MPLAPLNCCTRCFQSKEVIQVIKAEGHRGPCDFCKHEPVEVIPAPKLASLFEPLFFLFAPQAGSVAPSDRSSADLLSLADLLGHWEIFSTSLPLAAQNAILDEIRFGKLGPIDRSNEPSSAGNWDYKPATKGEDVWSAFVDYIKHKRRFVFSQDGHSVVAYPADWLPEALARTDLFVEPELPLFRARVGHHMDFSSGPGPLPPHEMGSPPPVMATRGRANPVGISYLYVAEQEDTAIAEIRPLVSSWVTVCTFRAKKRLRVADISQRRSIDTPFGHRDLLTLVRQTGLLNVLGHELSRPVSPEDSELAYIPTQYLAEVILEAGYDGIRYRSSLRKGGTNIVFFDPRSLEVDPVTRLVSIDEVAVKYREMTRSHITSLSSLLSSPYSPLSP